MVPSEGTARTGCGERSDWVRGVFGPGGNTPLTQCDAGTVTAGILGLFFVCVVVKNECGIGFEQNFLRLVYI